MNTRKKRLRGTKTHRIDTKGRVSIPSLWRGGFGEEVFMLRSKYLGVDTLKIMTEEALDRYYDQIESMDWEPAKKNAMIGMLDSQTEELGLNSQGKLLIPKQVCEEQGFSGGDELALVGRGDHIEIYTAEKHVTMCKLQEEEIASADEKINVFGLKHPSS